MLTWLAFVAIAHAREFRGQDTFGRACAVELQRGGVSVLIEDEWYDGQGRAQAGVLDATVLSRVGREPAVLELHFDRDDPTWFSLSISSAATGFTHACRLNR